MKHNVILELLKTSNRVTKQNSEKIYLRLLHQVAKANPIPYRDDVLKAIRRKDIVALVGLADAMSSLLHDDADLHFSAHQFAALVRKYPFPGLDKHFQSERTAYEKFLKSERACMLQNRFFLIRRKTNVWRYEQHFTKMARFIEYVLGVKPSWSEVVDGIGFGPGASIGVHGHATNVARKILASSWTVTPGAYGYAYSACMNHAQLREFLLPLHGGFSSGNPVFDRDSFDQQVCVVKYNKIEFVPKTVQTKRSIAVEPLLNSLVQKGIDLMMRKRLKRINLDLSNQFLNSEMARQGSLDDSEDGFVTIDLRSASDSVCTELCRELLPPEWFHLLDATRSKEYVYKGRQATYHKFCTMGNGFNFPLQTLLYASACHAVGAGRPGIDFRVYGDDIVVRKAFAQPLITLLKRCGFKTNKRKTFVEGPFRESCGGNWFGGEDVTPYTLDERMDSIPALFKFLNQTQSKERWKTFFAPARSAVLTAIPLPLQLWRPFPGQPDTGLDSTGDEHLSTNSTISLTRGVYWTWTELRIKASTDVVAMRHEKAHFALLYAALLGSNSAQPFTLRRRTETSVRREAHSGATSQWLPPLHLKSRV